MRLLAAGLLVASLVVAGLAPAAQADCRISLKDPTNPEMSPDCTDTGRVREVVNGSTMTTVQAGTEEIEEIGDEIGICGLAVPCDNLLNASLSVGTDSGAEEPLTVDVDAEIADRQNEIGVEGNECRIFVAGGLVAPNPCSDL